MTRTDHPTLTAGPAATQLVAVPIGTTADGVVIDRRVTAEVAAYVDQLTEAVNDIECFSHHLCIETGHALIPREVVLERIREAPALLDAPVGA